MSEQVEEQPQPVSPQKPEEIKPFEMISFDIVNDKAILIVKAANGSLWAGQVKNFVQLSNGRT